MPAVCAILKWIVKFKLRGNRRGGWQNAFRLKRKWRLEIAIRSLRNLGVNFNSNCKELGEDGNISSKNKMVFYTDKL